MWMGFLPGPEAQLDGHVSQEVIARCWEEMAVGERGVQNADHSGSGRRVCHGCDAIGNRGHLGGLYRRGDLKTLRISGG